MGVHVHQPLWRWSSIEIHIHVYEANQALQGLRCGDVVLAREPPDLFEGYQFALPVETNAVPTSAAGVVQLLKLQQVMQKVGGGLGQVKGPNISDRSEPHVTAYLLINNHESAYEGVRKTTILYKGPSSEFHALRVGG